MAGLQFEEPLAIQFKCGESGNKNGLMVFQAVQNGFPYKQIILDNDTIPDLSGGTITRRLIFCQDYDNTMFYEQGTDWYDIAMDKIEELGYSILKIDGKLNLRDVPYATSNADEWMWRSGYLTFNDLSCNIVRYTPSPGANVEILEHPYNPDLSNRLVRTVDQDEPENPEEYLTSSCVTATIKIPTLSESNEGLYVQDDFSNARSYSPFGEDMVYRSYYGYKNGYQTGEIVTYPGRDGFLTDTASDAKYRIGNDNLPCIRSISSTTTKCGIFNSVFYVQSLDDGSGSGGTCICDYYEYSAIPNPVFLRPSYIMRYEYLN